MTYGYQYCSGCGEEVDWDELVYEDDEITYCYRHPKQIERRRNQLKRYEEIGHTGEPMCGCQMCAVRYETTLPFLWL